MNKANPSPAVPPVTIFVVDDEPLLLDLTAAVLEPLGYNVQTFTDPQKALAEFSAAKPALIVTDYAMGNISGLELIRECKRINPLQKIILVSGTVDQNIYTDASTKPDAFLAKPYEIHDLIESVQKLIAR